MKDLKLIEELLEKYYKGESSTAEEEVLREFFKGSDLPAHLEADARLFRYFTSGKEDTLPGTLESRLESLADEASAAENSYGRDAEDHAGHIQAGPGGSRRMSFRYYWYSGIAAVILVLVGIFIDMQMKKNHAYEVRQDTFQDPYIAYNEAKKALYMVSERLNEGTRPLKKIERLDTGIDYMHPVFSFGEGIQYLENLNRIEKTRQMISN